MNTRAKGKVIEKHAENILINDGWLVEKAKPKLMFIGPGKMISKEHDLWGKWDLMGVKEQQVIFVQCSVKSHLGDKRIQVARFPSVGIQQIWIYIPGRGRHFEVYDRDDGYEEVVSKIEIIK